MEDFSCRQCLVTIFEQAFASMKIISKSKNHLSHAENVWPLNSPATQLHASSESRWAPMLICCWEFDDSALVLGLLQYDQFEAIYWYCCFVKDFLTNGNGSKSLGAALELARWTVRAWVIKAALANGSYAEFEIDHDVLVQIPCWGPRFRSDFCAGTSTTHTFECLHGGEICQSLYSAECREDSCHACSMLIIALHHAAWVFCATEPDIRSRVVRSCWTAWLVWKGSGIRVSVLCSKYFAWFSYFIQLTIVWMGLPWHFETTSVRSIGIHILVLTTRLSMRLQSDDTSVWTTLTSR